VFGLGFRDRRIRGPAASCIYLPEHLAGYHERTEGVVDATWAVNGHYAAPPPHPLTSWVTGPAWVGRPACCVLAAGLCNLAGPGDLRIGECRPCACPAAMDRSSSPAPMSYSNQAADPPGLRDGVMPPVPTLRPLTCFGFGGGLVCLLADLERGTRNNVCPIRRCYSVSCLPITTVFSEKSVRSPHPAGGAAQREVIPTRAAKASRGSKPSQVLGSVECPKKEARNGPR